MRLPLLFSSARCNGLLQRPILFRKLRNGEDQVEKISALFVAVSNLYSIRFVEEDPGVYRIPQYALAP